MEISFHSHLDCNTVIATKFCTWHDSCAVVACAKICCDLMASNGVMARRNFYRISIAGKKTLVKWAPGSCVTKIIGLACSLAYRQVSNIWRTKSQYLKRFSDCLVPVFAESLEARCQVENEDVVGAAPTSNAPTTSEWSTISLPTKVCLIIY